MPLFQHQRLPPSDGIKSKGNTWILTKITFFSIKVEDNGEWKCTVRDKGLSSQDSHVFDLTVVNMDDRYTTSKLSNP